jgi:choline dehydrogenase-like flavoprotein
MGKSATTPSVIIVGGGTAGSVICSKLAPKFNVTVFEKSDNKKIPLLNRIPLLIGLLYSSKNVYVKKRDLQFDCTRSVPLFESNVVCGASAMNGCVHVLGIYSKWMRFLQRFNLELKDMERSYANNFSRSNDGKKISLRCARRSNLDIAFQDTFEFISVKKGQTDLMNEQACGPIINTTKKIFRSSVADLNPYRKANLKIRKKVTNLLLSEENKIVGVVADGEVYTADHVILAAGVIGTNELLLHPAIRAKDQEKINLNLKVGKGIKDHVNLRININSSDQVESLNIINKSTIRKIWVLIKHILGVDTLLIGTGATSSANLDVDGDGVVDTRINLLNFSENGRLGSVDKYFEESVHGFSISISSINPQSEGSIELAVSGECEVRPNYLHDQADVANINKAIDLCFSLLRMPPLSDYVFSIKDEQKILKDRKSFLRENAYSGYHLIGGCHNLVDENFQVGSFGNLYICDASVFDEYVSSNIHASIVITADLFAGKFIDARSGK